MCASRSTAETTLRVLLQRRRTYPLSYENVFFLPSGSKVSLSLPAPKRECGIFGPGMMALTLAFGSDGNLHVLWTGQLFTSLVV